MDENKIEYYCPECLTLLTDTDKKDWYHCWRDRASYHKDECK